MTGMPTLVFSSKRALRTSDDGGLVKRRELLAPLIRAATVLPARAAPAGRVRRVGVLMGYADTDPEPRMWLGAFLDSLGVHGWVTGQNIEVDDRWVGDDVERTRATARELVALASDLLLASTNPVIYTLKQITTTIPIVFVVVPDPVGAGFVKDLAAPGGNITGFTNLRFSMSSKWLETLKQAAPKTERVAVVYDPRNPSWPNYWSVVQAAAPLLGVRLSAADGPDIGDIARSIDRFAQEGDSQASGLLVFPSPQAAVHRDQIISLAAHRRLPAVYPVRYFAVSGGLISYGASHSDLFRRAGNYADRILRGEKPGQLPVQQPSRFELVINLKTATSLGLTVPARVMARAEEVIE